MSLIKKIFGFGGGSSQAPSDVFLQAEDIIENQVETLIEFLQLDLDFKISFDENQIICNFHGKDVGSLTDKDAMLLDAMQTYVKRSVQHALPDAKMAIQFDADGYREDALNDLIDLADKLKGIALDKHKAVYFRALPPGDRKVVHQHLAKDERVKSKSVGDGHQKKIKIFPADLKPRRRGGRNNNQRQNA
tara:strand:+ start:7518 stop:8087 length:570 start_codon:yes stop_codon:yes gene_type:complete